MEDNLTGSTMGLTGSTLGKYAIHDIIGRGGMATVYKATLSSLHIPVAFKVFEGRMKKLARTRFIREARLSLGLPRHDNVVFVYDAGWLAGKRFIAMELVEGEDLQEIIDRGGFDTVGKTVEIISQVCRGLEFIHEHGIVHRDIKPHNIIVDRSGRVKISDFGIAEIASTGPLLPRGRGAGTPKYMPPEVIRGDARLDVRSDIYSLGLVLYELLTGADFFTGDTSRQVLRKVVEGDLVPCHELNSDIPVALSRVVMKALSAKPSARYKSMSAFRSALESFSSRQPAGKRKKKQGSNRSLLSQALGILINPFSRKAAP